MTESLSQSPSACIVSSFFNRLTQAPDPEGARQRCPLSLCANQPGNHQQLNRIKGTIEGRFLSAFPAWEEDYVVFMTLINTDIYGHVFDLPEEENDG